MLAQELRQPVANSTLLDLGFLALRRFRTEFDELAAQPELLRDLTVLARTLRLGQ